MPKKKYYPAQQPQVHDKRGFTPSGGLPFQSNTAKIRPDVSNLNAVRNKVDTGKLKDLMTLYIEHVPTGYWVQFPAYLEGYSDAYNSEWSSEQVYGRMDPIATFGHTRRALSLAWNVPASSREEAISNMDKINTTVSFLYPLYDDDGSSQGAILNMGPLWRIKFGNLVHNAATGGPLMGYVNGITVDPLLEEGMFTIADRETDQQMNYYPKTVRLNVELVVLHEHNMGWKMNGEYAYLRGGGKGFPYATQRSLTDTKVNETRASTSSDPNSPGFALNKKAFRETIGQRIDAARARIERIQRSYDPFKGPTIFEE